MIIAAIIIMALGVATTGAATVLEIKWREPVWAIFIKIGAAAFAIGGVLFGVGMALA